MKPVAVRGFGGVSRTYGDNPDWKFAAVRSKLCSPRMRGFFFRITKINHVRFIRVIRACYPNREKKKSGNFETDTCTCGAILVVSRHNG